MNDPDFSDFTKAVVTQQVECLSEKQEVGSSILPPATLLLFLIIFTLLFLMACSSHQTITPWPQPMPGAVNPPPQKW